MIKKFLFFQLVAIIIVWSLTAVPTIAPNTIYSSAGIFDPI